MYLKIKKTFEKKQLLIVCLLIAFVVFLNFYMLNKVISNSNIDHNYDSRYERTIESSINVNR